MDFILCNNIDSFLQKNDISGAASYLESLLKKEDSERFTSLGNMHFTNSPEELLEHINQFISTCSETFDNQSVYLEMNGFDINCGLWFFSFFGFTEYGEDPEDLDWFSDWSSPDFIHIQLTGLETIQEDFQWYNDSSESECEEIQKARDIAEMLVLVRFLQIVQSAMQSEKLAKPIPVLATAHGFDIFDRFKA